MCFIHRAVGFFCKTTPPAKRVVFVEAFAVEQSRRGGRLPCVKGAVTEGD